MTAAGGRSRAGALRARTARSRARHPAVPRSPTTDRAGGRHPAVPRTATTDGVGLPTSPCGPHCLPSAAPGGRMRAAARGATLLAAVALAAGSAPLLALLGARGRRWWLRTAARLVLAAAGVRLRVTGTPWRGDPGLVVANHRSWIDVLALLAVAPLRPLAKREVRGWPLLGAVAAAAGALFVDRAGLRALPATVAALAAALRAGEGVLVFPEGTTWCGAAAGPFRRAAFQAALDAGAPVRPVALLLRDPDGGAAPEAGFLGEETLGVALGRVLRHRGVVCEIALLPPVAASDRRALAALAGAAVAARTGVAHPRAVRAAAPAGPPGVLVA